MSRVDAYRRQLRSLGHWDDFLMQESGLPGPRGNLELARAVMEEGSEEQFARWLTLPPAVAGGDTPAGYLFFCGVMGLGRLLAEGQRERAKQLLCLAADGRWRVREAVAMALQRYGERDMERLLDLLAGWPAEGYLEARAAAAAICEPALLRRPEHAGPVLHILERATELLAGAPATERKGEPYRVLRQGLGYCWSVAVAAYPETGRPAMERWLRSEDRDILWVMKENLKKSRLLRLDPEWVATWRSRLERSDRN